MAKELNADVLARYTFWVTFAGCLAYILVVAFFILSAEPSSTPQTPEAGHHD